MQAEELSDEFKGKPIHIGAINVKELVKPEGGNSVAEVMQNDLDEIYAQRKRTGQAMFPHLNHPNKRTIQSQKVWMKIDDGIEIAETIYQSPTWDKLRRLVMVRQKV